MHCMAWVAGQAWVVHLAHEQTHQAIAIKWNLKRLIQSGGDQGLCLCDCMAAGNKCATTLRTSGCPCSQHAISAAVVACCSMRSAIVLRPRMASQQSNGPSALPSAFCNAMDLGLLIQWVLRTLLCFCISVPQPLVIHHGNTSAAQRPFIVSQRCYNFLLPARCGSEI